MVAARKAERAANSEVAALRARVEALSETLRQGVDATAAVLADPERFRGVLGSFAAQLTVADGYQKAIAAALGAAAEALTVNGLDAAVEVLGRHPRRQRRHRRPGHRRPPVRGLGPGAGRPAAPRAAGRRALGGRPGDRVAPSLPARSLSCSATWRWSR